MVQSDDRWELDPDRLGGTRNVTSAAASFCITRPVGGSRSLLSPEDIDISGY